MHPYPLRSWAVFIGMISIHKSYSASRLHQFDAAGWMKNARSWQRKAPPSMNRRLCCVTVFTHALSVLASMELFFPPSLLSLNIYYWGGLACRSSWYSFSKIKISESRMANQAIWIIKVQMIQWSLNNIQQHLSAEMMSSITFVWWLSHHLPVVHVILYAHSPKTIHAFLSCWQKDGCECSALAAKWRANINTAKSALVGCAGVVSDVSRWKIMEGLVFVCLCEADVCFRYPGPLRCDATHPISEPLFFAFMISHQTRVKDRGWEVSVPDRSVTSIFLSVRLKTLYFWATAECEKKGKKLYMSENNCNMRTKPACIFASYWMQHCWNCSFDWHLVNRHTLS